MANDIGVNGAPGKRGKKTTFESLGVPAGSELVFKGKPDIKCVTVDAVNMVEYEGGSFSISSLASKLNNYPSSGYHYFTYKGVLLSKMKEPARVEKPSGQPCEPGGVSEATAIPDASPAPGVSGDFEPKLPLEPSEFDTL
jgi:hypothetical protein